MRSVIMEYIVRIVYVHLCVAIENRGILVNNAQW